MLYFLVFFMLKLMKTLPQPPIGFYFLKNQALFDLQIYRFYLNFCHFKLFPMVKQDWDSSTMAKFPSTKQLSGYSDWQTLN